MAQAQAEPQVEERNQLKVSTIAERARQLDAAVMSAPAFEQWLKGLESTPGSVVADKLGKGRLGKVWGGGVKILSGRFRKKTLDVFAGHAFV